MDLNKLDDDEPRTASEQVAGQVEGDVVATVAVDDSSCSNFHQRAAETKSSSRIIFVHINLRLFCFGTSPATYLCASHQAQSVGTV